MIAERHISLQQLDAIAVAIGPGSFNGVRVALATAKALAFSLQKPLVGISTLEMIAAEHGSWRGPVGALLEAGRSELYAAYYLCDEDEHADGDVNYRLKLQGEYLVCSPEQLATYLQENAERWMATSGEVKVHQERDRSAVLFCGEISAASRQALRHYLPGQSIFVPALHASRHASVLAQLALQRVRDGQVDDPLLLEPLYLRRPSITKSTRKQPLLTGDRGKQDIRGTSARPGGQDTTEREEGAIRH
jgi:tRNA threonylcarbamoyladenosine biosynthesis protein TsaB